MAATLDEQRWAWFHALGVFVDPESVTPRLVDEHVGRIRRVLKQHEAEVPSVWTPRAAKVGACDAQGRRVWCKDQSAVEWDLDWLGLATRDEIPDWMYDEIPEWDSVASAVEAVRRARSLVSRRSIYQEVEACHKARERSRGYEARVRGILESIERMTGGAS